jgi:putative transcriptional regulator
MKTNLRRYRFERGDVSQQELAERAGVSRQTVVAIEKGNYNPSVKLAMILARELNISVEQLFELEEGDRHEA